MRIVVLGGSPKGEVSVTMRYVEYLRRRFPEHELVTHHVAQRVGRLARDRAAFDRVVEDVRHADGVIWAFPLYILLVCSQLKRFIELLFERNADAALAGKHVVSLSTSINYFDHCAHDYIRSVSEDLGMRYVGFYSANMTDLQRDAERERLTLFATDFFRAIRTDRPAVRRYAPLPATLTDLRAASAPAQRAGDPDRPRDLRVLIITDEADALRDTPERDRRVGNLHVMVARLTAAFGPAAKVVDLKDLDIHGGCLGCLRCGQAYECAYQGKDGFVDFYRDQVMQADVIVLAGAVVDRQLSWRWRRFFDRSFFNTHTPVLTGTQVAMVVSGPVGAMTDFQKVYEAWFELQEANLVEIVSDEADRAAVFANLDALAERTVSLAREGYVRPRTFLGIAGMKIFRDDIFGHLRIPFPADHAAYRARGYYDFPTRNPIRRLAIAALALVLRLPFVRRGFVRGIRTAMAGRYRKVLAATVPAAQTRSSEPT